MRRRSTATGTVHDPEFHNDRRDDDPAQPGREGPDADLLREMIGFAAERLMELEVGGLLAHALQRAEVQYGLG